MIRKLLRPLICALGLLMAAALVVSNLSPSDRSIKDRVVKLAGPEHGSCTGEQVRAPSGVDYILTAAHCRILEKNGSIIVIDEAGHRLMRRVLAEDPTSDLLLLEGLPNVTGLKIAKHAYRSEHLRSFTHGGGMSTYKTEGEAIGVYRDMVMVRILESAKDAEECVSMPKYMVVDMLLFKVCVLSVEFMASTVQVIPGSSGGPVVNRSGDLVGVVSALGGPTSYLVRLNDIQDFLAGY